MSVNQSDHPHEIIIVKHARGDDHGDHHGGVWKIAFADFMTALMCFFLVMWLINAANEETKVSVASYFNPIKLVDRNSSRRGLDDIGAGPKEQEGSTESDSSDSTASKSTGPSSSGVGEELNSKDGDKAELQSDEHLFSDPYAVLAEIAAESGELQNLSAKGEGGAQTSGAATGASGGESFRDPFAPDFWSKQVEQDQPGEPDLFEHPQVPKAAEGTDPRSGLNPVPADADPFADDVFHQQARQAEAAPAETGEAGERKKTVENDTDTGVDPAALAAAEEIRAEIEQAFGSGERIAEGFSVTPTERGVMISLTDQLDYGMFEVGSAVPRRDLVLAMEKVAAILNGHRGKITINGHTDGRPFKSDTYDNWRLSSARAHSAYYMLVRGGLEEKRVQEVAGFADRQLKVPDEPYSDVNRRIEIFLETRG